MTERGFFRWLRPWIFPAVLIGAFEWYARRASALGSDALAPPSAAAKALVGAALDAASSWLPWPVWRIFPTASALHPAFMKCWGSVTASGTAFRKLRLRS